MKNWLFLCMLAVILGGLAFVVRFGIINFDQPEDRDREQRIARLYPGSYKSISGLHFVVNKRGEGETPYPGTIVTFHYTLRLLGSDQVLENSADTGGPVKARVGQPPMLKGLSEGILGMRVGEQRTILLPPQLAYGSAGQAPNIPGGSTLVYEVELLSVDVGGPGGDPK